MKPKVRCLRQFKRSSFRLFGDDGNGKNVKEAQTCMSCCEETFQVPGPMSSLWRLVKPRKLTLHSTGCQVIIWIPLLHTLSKTS
jgi:hypothetical protein